MHPSQKKSLKQRIFRAGSWTLIGYALAQAIRLGSNLLMTRLLAPDMFGIMAIATMVIHALNLFSDLGLRQSIIRSKLGNNEDFLNTAWITQILRGGLIFLGCIALSAGLHFANDLGWLPSESTFTEPQLPAVLAIVALNAIIAGFESTKLLTASRKLALGRITAIDLASQTFGFICMVIYAIANPTIWALVTGGVAAALSRTILSHIAFPGPSNRFRWNTEFFLEIFHFGKWIFISSILGALLGSADRLLLGGLVSAETLGLYSIAFLLVNTVRTVYQKLMAFVIYPALSETARQRPDELPAHYYRFRLPIDITCLLFLGFLFISGPRLIEILYDDRYQIAGQYLAILAWSLYSVRFGIASQYYLAIGKPQILTLLTVTSVVSIYATVPLAFHQYGLLGALWAIALSPMLSLPIIFYINHKHGILDFGKELLFHGALPAGIGIGYIFNILTRMS